MEKTAAINLLRESQTHRLDTFLKWALTTGRFLIILTETIALSAFVYRFSLDREIIDLADEIRNNSIIVSIYTDEPRYRNLQERLDYVETLDKPPVDTTALMKELVSLARGKVIYQSLSVSTEVVNLNITTTSTAALSSFLDTLKTVDLIKSVNVERVENKAGSGTITAGITAQLITTKEEIPDVTK